MMQACVLSRLSLGSSSSSLVWICMGSLRICMMERRTYQLLLSGVVMNLWRNLALTYLVLPHRNGLQPTCQKVLLVAALLVVLYSSTNQEYDDASFFMMI